MFHVETLKLDINVYYVYFPGRKSQNIHTQNMQNMVGTPRSLDPEMGRRSTVYGQKSIHSKFSHLHGNISVKFH